ncbi:MAG: hypothetical protein U0165_09155 [Polyangiaceae bacterium]
MLYLNHQFAGTNTHFLKQVELRCPDLVVTRENRWSLHRRVDASARIRPTRGVAACSVVLDGALLTQDLQRL